MDDADLVARITAGDRAAEAALVRRFAPRIRLYGLRHLRGAAAADDLVQAVLLVVLERARAGELRDAAKLASFVLGTSRLVAGQWRAGEARRDGLLATFGDDLAPAAAPAPALDVERLGACLDRLGERERTVVVLTFYDDRDADEIAARLAMSAGNVRVVRHRALGKLASCLGAPELIG